MKMKFRQVVCLYRSVHQELRKRCIPLSVGFHFLLVKCVVKCGVDHTWQRTSASLFDLRTFPWPLSKVQVRTFYPATPKVGSKYSFECFSRNFFFFFFFLIEIHTSLPNITDNTNIRLIATYTTNNIHAVIYPTLIQYFLLTPLTILTLTLLTLLTIQYAYLHY